MWYMKPVSSGFIGHRKHREPLLTPVGSETSRVVGQNGHVRWRNYFSAGQQGVSEYKLGGFVCSHARPLLNRIQLCTNKWCLAAGLENAWATL